MGNASKRRRSKRDVIVIDDDKSTSDEPVVKRGKESVLSPEVIELQKKNEELQQKLDKSEEKYQSLFRIAGEYQKRDETAESRLDSKFGIKDVLNAETKGSDNSESSYLARENEALKAEMAEMRKEHQESLNKLTVQRDKERLQARDSQAKNRARIGCLEKKLAQYEGEPDPDAMQSPGDNETAPATIPLPVELDAIAHPTNILQLCRPDSNETMSYAAACGKIQSIVNKNEGKGRQKVYQCFARSSQPDCLTMVVHCNACAKWQSNAQIIRHFISREHWRKVSALGAAVSSAALAFWVDKLQPDPQLQQHVVELHATSHPTNIFHLCRPDSNETTPFEIARAQMLSVTEKLNGEPVFMKMNQVMAKNPAMQSMSVYCEACVLATSVRGIIPHFIGKTHHKKVSALGAAVSSAALAFWMDKLQPEPEIIVES